MHNELTRYNSIGCKKGIFDFAQTVLTTSHIPIKSARILCTFKEGMRLNFNCAILAFEFLGLLKTKGKELYPLHHTGVYKSIEEGIEEFSYQLCKQCIHSLFEQQLINLDAIKYNETDGYFYIQRYAFPLKIALFRNLLIELDALVEDGSNNFRINHRFEMPLLEEAKENRVKLSQEQLLLQLEAQRNQGRLAEEFAFRYEQTRLLYHPRINEIRLISDIDVSAGFDLVSFKDMDSIKPDIFIEVKSYKGIPHFYWSENEISQAKLKNKQYYLYLIDMDKISFPDYQPTIIIDPAKSILDSSNWIVNPTSFKITQIV